MFVIDFENWKIIVNKKNISILGIRNANNKWMKSRY